MMNALQELTEILAELLDIEDLEITPETYIVRDLGAESIDLLELALALNARFRIEVNDNEIFLTRLRVYITEAEKEGSPASEVLSEKLPFLSTERITEILEDLDDGPTLKVKDLIQYIEWKRR